MKLNADLTRWLSAAVTVLISSLPLGGGAQTPVISEFVALNVAGLTDENNQVFDWLELHNPAGSPVDLGGYFLTDKVNNLTKWSVPEGVVLQPGGTRVVFASEKDRRNPAANLHTNFKLSGSGEYLALVAPDGVTVVHGFGDGFPAQVEDFSYGLANSVEVGNVGFFEVPTPGALNGGSFASFVGKVEFSHESAMYFEDFDLVLSGAKPGETIRYTTRTNSRAPARNPTVTSTAYTGPIAITTTTRVRARVFAADGTPGEVLTHTLFRGSNSSDARFVGSPFKDFKSHLPIVVFTNFGQRKPGNEVEHNMHWMIFEPKEEDGGLASVTNTPDLATRGRMKVRGSSTEGNAKYSLSVEAWDENDDDLDVEVLGMPAEADWILSARFNFDRALVRNPLMYELSNQMGRQAVRTRFVEVFMDDSGGEVTNNPDYFGVYAVMEKIERGGDRVDVTKLNAGDTEAPELTGGYLFKNDRRDDGDGGFQIRIGRVSPMSSLSYVEPKEPEIEEVPEQRAYLTDELTDAGNALFAVDDENTPENEDGISPATGRHFSEIIDVPAWIDHHWLNTLAMNVDGFRLSGYYHKPRNGPIVAGPIWDFDRTMESNDGRDDNPLAWDGPPDSSRTWFDNRYQLWGWLLGYKRQLSLNTRRPISFYPSARPDVFQQHTDRYFELREQIFSVENIHGIIDRMTGEIGDAQARNFSKWRGVAPRRSSSSRVRKLNGTYAGEVAQLKEWLKQRVEWFDAQYPEVPNFNTDGGVVDAGFPLDATARAGSILLTTDGSDPRLSGGSAAPGTHLMGEPAILSSTETVVGEDAGCVFLVPVDSSVDEVWRDVGFDAGSWTAASNGLGWDTGLQADGGGLWPAVSTDIKAAINTISSSVYVRYPFEFDKGELRTVTGGQFQTKFDDGYIAYLNGVKIAERNAPVEPPSNESSASATNSDSAAIIWANASLIDVEAFKSAVRDGSNVLAVQMLNSSSTSDILFRGVLSLDVDTQQSAPEPLVLTESGLVTARTKDGWMWSAPKQAYFLIGEERASASNLVVSEVMYHPGVPTAAEIAAGFDDEDDFEFIELLNPGDQTVNLYELEFSEGVGFDFSEGDITSLRPGERGLVVRKRKAFEMRYGAGLPVIGKYGGDRLNNAGELVTLLGAGGATVQSFTYSDSSPWPTGADGTGVSLVLKSPGTFPDHNLPESWAAGGHAGGSPGFPDGAYIDWKTANDVRADFGDRDGDGTFELAEFILGTGLDDPATGLATNGPSAGLTELDGSTVPTVSVVLSDAAVAGGAFLEPEVSADLENWVDGSGPVTLVGEVSNGDGTTTRVYRVDESVGSGEWYVRFLMGIR